MPAARLLVGPIAVMVCLVGCTQPPPPRPEVDVSQAVAAPPEDVLRRAETAFRELGLSVVEDGSDGGRVQAQGLDLDETGWAQCPDPWVYDRDYGQRRRRAQPLDLDLDLTLTTRPEQDGTAVTLRPRFERTYMNTFTNLDFSRRCRSTGALERQIFERLQAT